MSNKGEKFLFNQNIFDEPDIEEEIIEDTPVPTFSEEELETVRKTTHDKAYNAGKQDGIQSEKSNREDRVARILEKIGHDSALLFAAEEERERLYEAEALRLALEIFGKLFPYYKEQHGFNELTEAITDILNKQHGQSKITIEVNPANVEGVLSHVATLSKHGHDASKYDIVGTENIDEDSFVMRWTDGGALCHRKAIADEIASILHHTLAGSPTNRHDGREGVNDIAAQPTQISEPEENPDQPVADDLQPVQANQPGSDAIIDDDTIMEKPDE